MSRIAKMSVPFVILAVCAGARAVKHDINQLTWMAGCWEYVTGDRITEEQWLAPRGGLMLGQARTVRAGMTTDYETMRIEQVGDSVVSHAQPLGQAPGRFVATVVSSNELVLQNLEHDFPQRVIYRNRGDSLLASIEGMYEGKQHTIPFPMARAQCSGAETGRS